MSDDESLNREPEALKAVLTALAKLEPEEQSRVMAVAASKFKIAPIYFSASSTRAAASSGGSSALPGVGIAGQGASDDLPDDPKVFLAAKKPTNAAEQIACLGYYLTYGRGQRKFSNEDLRLLNDDAAGRRIGNLSQTVKNTMQQSAYLVADGDGNRQITARGEAIVNALPNREAVKQAQDEFPGGRRSASRKAGAKKERQKV